MNKKQIKEILIARQENLISELKTSMARYDEVQDIDENATHDPEDYSHQDESRDLKRTMEEKIRYAESTLNYLQRLPTDKMDKVEPGAIVVTDGPAFHFSVASEQFEMNGKKLIFISEEAPIASILKQKSVGDTIELGPNTHRIESIE